MLKLFQRRDFWIRCFLGLVVGVIGLTMVITLVPGFGSPTTERPDVVATVGGRDISRGDVQRMLSRIAGQQSIPKALESFYARQVVDQLIFERLLDLEARRLGLAVSEEEQADRIKMLVPSIFAGNNFVGREAYQNEIAGRFQMTVAEFEDAIRKSLLEEKVRRLLSDGITTTPADVEQEFRRRNEKIQIEYVVLQPFRLESQVSFTETELTEFFEKNKVRYQVPERRSVRFAMLDKSRARQAASVTDADLRAYYEQHIERFRVQNRANVSSILFKTGGKSDAEIAEIRLKAEEVLKKARRGERFEALAREYSEDATKDAGGNLGWIVEGQTVPEFERVAFSLPKGQISDLVQTQYGFHILRVNDREAARTKSLDEVRGEILPIVTERKIRDSSGEMLEKLADAIRRGSRRPIEEVAREYQLRLGESPPAAVTEPVGELGMSQAVHDAVFRLRPGELSPPVTLEQGIAVLSLKEVVPAHQGTFQEVRDRVESDFRREKAVELARSRAEEIATRAKSGEGLITIAKRLGVEAKTSDFVARVGSVPEIGSVREISTAFGMAPGTVSPPIFLSPNWVVFKLLARQDPNPGDFATQYAEIEQSLVRERANVAYEAFRDTLRQRMAAEGVLTMNAELISRLTSPGQ